LERPASRLDALTNAAPVENSEIPAPENRPAQTFQARTVNTEDLDIPTFMRNRVR
jgi:hypothetical protein